MAINPFGGCAVSAPTPVAAIPLTVSIPFWQASVSTAEVLLETARNNFVELSQQVAAKAVQGMAQKVATIKNKLASFTKARKAIDIAEDAASTFGKAGSHRAGPGKLKAIRDYIKNKFSSCGGRSGNSFCPPKPIITPNTGKAAWLKIVDMLGDTLLDNINKRVAKRLADGKSPFSQRQQIHVLKGHSTKSFPNHDKGTLFPDGWSDKKILNSIENVADNPTKTLPLRNKAGDIVPGNIFYGTIDGKVIRVIVKPGKKGIRSGYPVDAMP